MKAAVIGGGVIGGGWAARFLLHGWDVSVADPHPEAASRLAATIDCARASLPALADQPMPKEGQLTLAGSIDEAVSGANWVQESVSEQHALKQKVLAEIQQHIPGDTIIGSSTSGFKPSELQQGANRPGQILVAHPFNPVYLLPLVEVVASPVNKPETTQRACELLQSIGMHPLVVRKEVDAHIADRLMESAWREALWMIKDDVATTGEIDDAIRFGFGLRWAQMGMFDVYRLGGGDEGMVHFIRQFGPALAWPWSKLTDVPELTEELVQKISHQSDAQSDQHTIGEMTRIRDRNLVGILRSLKECDFGAGAMLNEHDKRLSDASKDVVADIKYVPLRLLDLTVLPAWIDYNGHMTEFRYVQVFSDSCEALLRRVGMLDDYVAAGHSYYTAESHAQFFDEVGVDQPMYTTVQILFADAKRLHVYYRLHATDDDRLLSALEAMYLHVNIETGKVSAASPEAMEKLMHIAGVHAALPGPEAAGRYVGQR